MINEGKQDMYYSTMFSIFSILLTHIRSMYGTLTQIHYKNQLNVGIPGTQMPPVLIEKGLVLEG